MDTTTYPTCHSSSGWWRLVRSGTLVLIVEAIKHCRQVDARRRDPRKRHPQQGRAAPRPFSSMNLDAGLAQIGTVDDVVWKRTK